MSAAGRLPKERVFTFFEPVPPTGGGTFCVAGSHHLATDVERELGGPVRSAQVRDRLKARHAWLDRLLDAPRTARADRQRGTGRWSPGPSRGNDRGTGDLVVMHPATLHAAARYTLDRPRLMLTEWIPRSG